MRRLGYTRVSTAGQDAALQVDALLKAGVEKRDIFSDVTSGAKSAAQRPAMKRLLSVIDRTGQAAYEARLSGQLSRRGLSSYGTDLP